VTQSVCADAASVNLPAWVMAGAIEEAGTAAELATARAEGMQANVADASGKSGACSSPSQATLPTALQNSFISHLLYNTGICMEFDVTREVWPFLSCS